MKVFIGVVIFAVIFVYVVTDGFTKISLPL